MFADQYCHRAELSYDEGRRGAGQHGGGAAGGEAAEGCGGAAAGLLPQDSGHRGAS